MLFSTISTTESVGLCVLTLRCTRDHSLPFYMRLHSRYFQTGSQTFLSLEGRNWRTLIRSCSLPLPVDSSGIFSYPQPRALVWKLCSDQRVSPVPGASVGYRVGCWKTSSMYWSLVIALQCLLKMVLKLGASSELILLRIRQIKIFQLREISISPSRRDSARRWSLCCPARTRPCSHSSPSNKVSVVNSSPVFSFRSLRNKYLYYIWCIKSVIQNHQEWLRSIL